MKPLSQESVAEIKQHFEFFDRDGNGYIDIKEFIELIKAISPKATDDQAVDGFELVDNNQDGLIEFREFLTWWRTVWYEF